MYIFISVYLTGIFTIFTKKRKKITKIQLLIGIHVLFPVRKSLEWRLRGCYAEDPGFESRGDN